MNIVNNPIIDLELSVIVPCYNEKDNVEPLFKALVKALEGYRWEVIFVDDNSPDATFDEVKKLKQHDSRVKGLLRVDKRGLSSAVMDGVLLSAARCVAVIDGDMQHDETRLPYMLRAVLYDEYDIAVGSRHIEGGAATGLANRWRHLLSNTGIWLAQQLLPVPIKDPMSGFFLLRRTHFLQLYPRLSGAGFKILLDILISSETTVRVKEVPFCFRQRMFGESKLDINVMIQFIIMIIKKGTYKYKSLIFMLSFICMIFIYFKFKIYKRSVK